MSKELGDLVRGAHLAIICGLCGGPAGAGDVAMASLSPETAEALRPVVSAAEAVFANMPAVQLTEAIGGACGGGAVANPFVQYCSDLDVIFVAHDLAQIAPPQVAQYMLAHVYGHAVQVVYGQATLALRAIRRAPEREAELRGMVTRQVECLAGHIFGVAAGDETASLAAWFEREPFTDSHWGRTPMSQGPRVSIGLEARDRWFQRGIHASSPGECAVGELGADLFR